MAVPTRTPEQDVRLLNIAIGSDHLGLELKVRLRDHLEASGYAVTDYGCPPGIEVDYPDIAVDVAQAVSSGRHESAILICGTGLGMAIAANKVAGIRAASVSDSYSAERARASNDAQILCLGALVVGPALATMLVDIWLGADFGGGRSARKVAKINALDAGATAS